MGRYLLLAALIVLAAVARVLPHPDNFTPLGAIALFVGATFSRTALLVPLAAMLVSDAVIGFHALVPVIYGCLALNVVMGRLIPRTVLGVGAATLAGSVFFFIITNFACWAMFDGHSSENLLTAYVDALPFFRNAVLGDAFYSTILFGGLALAEFRFPTLRPAVLASY